MSSRRIPLTAGAVIVILAVVLVSHGLTVWSQPRPTPDLVVPTGPAEDAAGQARADLAFRLGADADAIEVDSAVAHTWADASLDVPEPGMMYAQVATAGHEVTLSYDGQTYTYHVAGGTVILKPEDSLAPVPPAGAQPVAADRAREDLAGRLGVTVDEIAVESVEGHTWRDTSLGLPEPGMMYAQVLTAGQIVRLSYGGQTYVYHVAGQAVKLNEAAH